MHSFALLSVAKSKFLESREGKTYMRLQDHDSLAKRLISQIRGPCGSLEKWNNKVAHMVRKITRDEAEVQYVDVDEVLYGLMNEFKN